MIVIICLARCVPGCYSCAEEQLVHRELTVILCRGVAGAQGADCYSVQRSSGGVAGAQGAGCYSCAEEKLVHRELAVFLCRGEAGEQGAVAAILTARNEGKDTQLCRARYFECGQKPSRPGEAP
eukprot:351970-Chlamydomonas_euryale.AAC.7